MYPSRRLHLALIVSISSPIAAHAAEVDEPGKPQEVVTIGERQPYRAISAAGATKTDTSLKDLPQSVRVLTADLLKDVGVKDLAGALDMTSGVIRQSNLGGLWDTYAMRGFTSDPNYGSDFLVNGFSSSRGYNGIRDIAANATSIEVLKGPVSALYGRGEPGGTVNITTKKPLFQPAQAVEASLGSFNTRRGAVDLTGPINDNIAFRINAAYQQGDSFRDTVSGRRALVSPSLLWTIGDNTTLSYEIEAVRQKTPFDRGVVAVKGVLGRIPVSRFLGEPNDGPVTIESVGHQVFAQHFFNDDWSLQSGLSYRDSSLLGNMSEASALLADGHTLHRQRRTRDFQAKDMSGRIELVGKFNTGSLTHHVLAGIDTYRFDDRRIQYRVNPTAAEPYAIDIDHPVYGQTPPAMRLSNDTFEVQRAHGVYLQDQIDLARQWKALLGLRLDRYHQTVTNYRANTVNAQSLSATSPRVGLVYQPGKAASLYLSAAKGFRPNNGVSLENTGFPAEESMSYELGAKIDSDNGKLSGTVALFHVIKDNVLTINPANTDFSLPQGEVRNQGLEVDAAGEIMRDLRLSLSYAYIDSRWTKGDSLFPAGSRFTNVPKHSGTVLLVRNFALGDGAASFGGGATYVGARYGDVGFASGFTLPAYTVAKLIATYKAGKHWRYSLNIDNLFNKAYYASSFSQLWVQPGSERTVTLTANYKF